MYAETEANPTKTDGASTLAVVEAMTEATNRHDIDAVCAYIAEEYVDQGRPATRATWRGRWEMLLGAVPDLSIRAENTIVSGEWAASRYTLSGTHQGELFGLPATGRPFSITAIDNVRIVDGPLVERRAVAEPGPREADQRKEETG